MNATDMAAVVERNAVPVVFLNVLMRQLGLPVPAVPTLLLTGSPAHGPQPLDQLSAVAVLTLVLAEHDPLEQAVRDWPDTDPRPLSQATPHRTAFNSESI